MSIDALSSSASSQYGMMTAMLGRSGSKPPAPPDPAEIISNKDADGDGSLSIEEFGTSDKIFSEIDTDGDSLLTNDELQKHFDSKKAEMETLLSSRSALNALSNQSALQLPDVNEMISNRDEDGDGALSTEEFGAPEEIFSEIDTDGDGVINAEELQADMENRSQKIQSQMNQGIMGSMPPPPPKAEDIMSELDEDEDGSLSSEEFGASEEVFSNLDTNEDGVISVEELQAAMDKKAEEMQSQKASQGLNADTLASLLNTSDSENISADQLQSLLSYLDTVNSTDSSGNYETLKNYISVDVIA